MQSATDPCEWHFCVSLHSQSAADNASPAAFLSHAAVRGLSSKHNLRFFGACCLCAALSMISHTRRELSLYSRAVRLKREHSVWVSERERVFYLFIIRNNPSRNIKMQTTARWGEWRRAAVIKINELQTGFAYNTHTQRASVWRVVCARKAFSLCQCVHNGEYYCSTYRFMKNSCKMTTPPLWVTRTFSRKRRVHADADVHLPTCEHRKGNAFIKMGCRDEMIFVCFYSVKETWRPGKWGFATES